MSSSEVEQMSEKHCVVGSIPTSDKKVVKFLV
jgi:hypothetical protein